jgi:hypothetical protein
MGASLTSRKNSPQGQGIAPGLRLELELTVGNSTELHSSQVEEVRDDFLAVLVLMVRLRRRPMPSDAIVRPSYEANNRRWRFVIRVTGHSSDGLHDCLRMPVAVEDTARRRSFRLQTSLTPSSLFRLVVDPEDVDRELTAMLSGNIVDISEGEPCFTTRSPVEINERLGIRVHLRKAGDRIARLKATGVQTPTKQWLNRSVHCKFTNLSRRDRDRIARLVMKRQLELRRRDEL